MEYLNRMKTLYNFILEFLDSEGAEEDKIKYDELIKLLNSHRAELDSQELKSILRLISKLAKNHYRKPLFIDKIKQLVIQLKTEIKQAFSNIEIYHFFKKNKLILLHLIDEDILTFDLEILNQISRYEDFFYPEINKLNTNKQFDLPENYDEKRRKGENDSYLCEIIRNDDIQEFTIYCAKKGIPKIIKPSIYETNSFLEGKYHDTIEYSAFFGSMQILRYLFQNQVELPQSLWLYAIHGNNPDVIHFLEENLIVREDKSYQKCLEESIKCHHNDFALYFRNNVIVSDESSSKEGKLDFLYGFHYYNFEFIPIELNNPMCFFYAARYDYYKLVEYYENIEGLNINESSQDEDVFNYLLNLPDIEICRNCFKDCTLNKFAIPNHCTYIGDYAFFGCSLLSKITIPSSVTSIGDHSFEECYNLTEIVIPSSVTFIGEEAFKKCRILTEMIIPTSVTTIGNSFISECCSLEKIVIPDVQNMGKLFLEYFLLLTEFKIPSTVTRIYERAFFMCENLQIVEIPPSVAFIEKEAFSGCLSLKKVTIPPLVKSIENCTFQDCSSLSTVDIQGSITLIGFRAFSKCTSLVNITIPPSIQQIGFNAFQDCKSLKKIAIPSIGNDVSNIEIMTELPDKFNIIFLGLSNVGKTCIINKWIDNEFKTFQSTISFDFYFKMYHFQGHDVNIKIWDTPGVEKFRSTTRFYYKYMNATVAVFQNFFDEFLEVHDDQVQLVLLGSKSDLNHKVSIDDIKAIESKYNAKYFEVSAKKDSNIDDIFQYLANEIANYILSDKFKLLNLINNDQAEEKCNIF